MALTPDGKHFAILIYNSFVHGNEKRTDDINKFIEQSDRYRQACSDCIQFLKTIYFHDPTILASDSDEVKKTKDFLYSQKKRKHWFDVAEGYIGKHFGLFDKDLPIYSLGGEKWSPYEPLENWLVQKLDIDVSLL